jgi:hypothetical protein
MRNSGAYPIFWKNAFAQAMRTLVNEIEVDLFEAAYKNSSRAYGTAGTAPFGTASDLTDLAQGMKILDDNGAPKSTRQLVLGSSALANLRAKHSVALGGAGDPSLLKSGALDRLLGVDIHASGGISVHTKGTAASYAVDLTAGYAAGLTTVHIDTGTGTVLAGDVVNNVKTGRDSNKYICATGFAGDGDGDIVLNKPGLQVAWTNNDLVTVGNSYTPNMLFSRDALFLAARAPAIPNGGDAAVDEISVVDPISGMTFTIRQYPGFFQNAYVVCMVWGVAAIKDAHIATILG